MCVERGLGQEAADSLEPVQELRLAQATRVRDPALLPRVSRCRVPVAESLAVDVAVDGLGDPDESGVEELGGGQFALVPRLFALLSEELVSAHPRRQLIQSRPQHHAAQREQTS
jgi:hypothetical protein